MIEILKQFKSVDIKDMAKINYLLMPITKVDVPTYNEIVKWCHSTTMKRGIKRTPSGGISISGKSPLNVWDATPRKTRNGNITGCELVIIYLNYDFDSNETEYFGGRIQIGQISGDESRKTCGRNSFLKFKAMLEHRGIRIEDRFITTEEGLAIKEQIPKPIIKMFDDCQADKVYEHVYHIDINSSYASGMKEICPEWGDLIDYLYKNRKKKAEYKDVLNMTIGFFQSQYVGYRLSHISEYCIRRNNDKLWNKALELIKHGCKILLFNTDGFWFTNPKKYVIEDSHELGEFKVDHKDCTLRIKSAGVYEFIENDSYTPVVRGSTLLDRTLDRSQWQWGDIYKPGALPLMFEYNEDGTITEKTIEQKISE